MTMKRKTQNTECRITAQINLGDSVLSLERFSIDLIFLWDGRLARPGLGADKMSTPQELCPMQMQTAVKVIYTT